MNIVLIGKPGCGKGSLSEVLKKQNWQHLSPGEVMRAHMKDPQSKYREILLSKLNAGNFAPDDVTVEIVKAEVEKIKAKFSDEVNIVFDGFPRTAAQAQILLENFNIDLVVYFNIDDSVIIDRITNRLVHPASGRVYHKINKPPLNEGLDDVTGEALVVREDDKAHLVQQRIDNFMNLTYPAWEVLQRSAVDCLEVDGMQDPAKTAQQVIEKAQELSGDKKSTTKLKVS